MSERLVRIRRPLAAAAGLLAAVTYIALVDPSEGHYPLCPTKYVTGLDCPFCGGLRCVHSMAHARIDDAVHHNLLLVLATPIVALLWLRWFVREWRGLPAPARDPRRVRRTELALALVAVAFAVLRNLPVGSALASGSVR